jgi:hypothetical protein
MEFVYKYIGFVVFWFAGIVTSLYLLSKLFEWGINMLAKRYKPMWWIMEYVYRRKEFRKYMKYKKPAIKK